MNLKRIILLLNIFLIQKKNNNIYSRAWSIIYGFTPRSDKYKILLNNYFNKEKNFFQFIERKYNSLENLNQIEEFAQYFKKRYFYYNSNSFLWFHLTQKNKINYNLNKNDIEGKLIDIRKEMKSLTILENNANEPLDIDEDKNVLNEIQGKLEGIKNDIEFE